MYVGYCWCVSNPFLRRETIHIDREWSYIIISRIQCTPISNHAGKFQGDWCRHKLWEETKPALGLPSPQWHACDSVCNTCFKLPVHLPLFSCLDLYLHPIPTLPASLNFLAIDLRLDFGLSELCLPFWPQILPWLLCEHCLPWTCPTFLSTAYVGYDQ